MELPSTNNLYFACIDLTGRDCLVVGGGVVALEKIEGLLEAKAKIHVVAPRVDRRIEELADRDRLVVSKRAFRPSDISAAWLTIAATGLPEVDREVAAEAERRKTLVNVADVPELCNFILPAIVRDGPIAVGISTAGASPALGQRIKRDIASILERPFAPLAATLRSLRPWARAELPTYAARRDFFRAIVEDPRDPLTLIEEGRIRDLELQVEETKTRAKQESSL